MRVSVLEFVVADDIRITAQGTVFAIVDGVGVRAGTGGWRPCLPPAELTEGQRVQREAIFQTAIRQMAEDRRCA